MAWNARNPNPAILQDNVLSLRLAAFGGLGVVAGLMVQNSLDACRDHVQLGASALELVIFTESPNDLRMVRNGHHKSAIKCHRWLTPFIGSDLEQTATAVVLGLTQLVSKDNLFAMNKTMHFSHKHNHMDSCCQLAALLGSKPVIADQLLDVPTVMVRGSQYDYKPMWEMVRDGTGTPSRLPSFGHFIEAGYRIVTQHTNTYYIDLSELRRLLGFTVLFLVFFVIGSSKTATGRPPTPR